MPRLFGLSALLLLTLTGCAKDAREDTSPRAAGNGWRTIPLVREGQVAPGWAQVGYGNFAVDDGALRTDADERGLGLLLYTKEKFGDCQVRVVYRAEKPTSNAGVFVRIDDGILKHLDEKAPPAKRDEAGRLPPEGLKAMRVGSDREMGPWYAVHHGFEVQIADGGDEFHRTGAIYSYARADAAPEKPQGEWRTMLITLRGDKVLVDLDGKRVTEFDSSSPDVPARKQWHEPRREHQRPRKGYLGLQVHDPGDVVWFKEVSVKPL
jgi:hypothetical protein